MQQSPLILTLYNLSPELFYFLESLSVQEFSLQDELEDPTMVYSNIVDGFGVFGAYSKKSKSIIL